jgi:hypothetical protein
MKPTALLTSFALLAGCTSGRLTGVVERDRAVDGSLGRVAVVVCPGAGLREKDDALATAVRDCLAHTRGTTVVESSPLVAAMGSRSTTLLGEHETVVAARKLGTLDTVCLVFGSWSRQTGGALYGLRLVDVKSGLLRLHMLQSSDLDDLQDNLGRALENHGSPSRGR